MNRIIIPPKHEKIPINIIVNKRRMGEIIRTPKFIRFEGGYGLWEITILGKKYRTHTYNSVRMTVPEVKKLMETLEWHRDSYNDLLY